MATWVFTHDATIFDQDTIFDSKSFILLRSLKSHLILASELTKIINFYLYKYLIFSQNSSLINYSNKDA